MFSHSSRDDIDLSHFASGSFHPRAPPMAPVLIWLELCGISLQDYSWISQARSREYKRINKMNNHKKATIAGLARLLKCSERSIRRVAKAFYEGGDPACAKLKWGRGRSLAKHGLS